MKTRAILTGLICPPRISYFDGEGTPPPAAPVVTIPAGNQDIIDFKADDLPIPDFGGKPPAAPVPPVTPPVVPPVVPPKVGEPPKPPAEPPAKQLRDELVAVKAELATAKEQLGKGDPKVKELEAERDRINGDIAERDKRIAEYERKLAIADPAVTQELSKLDDGYNKNATRFAQSVPQLTGPMVNEFAVEFHNLPFGKPNYAEALANFEAKVNQAMGAADGTTHPRLEKALDFIRDTREFSLERQRLSKSIHDNALKLRSESEGKEYTGKREWVTKQVAAAKALPEGLEQADPSHPRVMLKKFESGLPAETVEKIHKGIPEFIELVLAGPKPFDPKDYSGMSEQEIAESRQRQTTAYENARANSSHVMYNGLLALRMFPSLVKEVTRLREKIAQIGGGTPPNPAGSGGASTPAGGDDLKTYVAPPVPEF